jgi:acyl carrier protein
MERSEVIRKVNGILEDEFEVDGDLLTPEATLYEELDLDSLDAVDLIVALEREFSITIDRKNAEKRIREIRTLVDVYDFIQSTLG